MNTKAFPLGLALACLVAAAGAADSPAPKENVFATEPLGIQVSIKMDGPYMEAADLQIICLFKHKASGDTYQGAAKETDAHLGSILSALRNRGEFVGELGETFLFTPPKGSIPAKRFMVIGLGEEKDLSLDSLHLVGRLAAREAVRLKAKHLAPQFLVEARHHREHDDERRDADHHARDRDECDDRDEGALRLEVSEGEEKAERQLHERRGRWGKRRVASIAVAWVKIHEVHV